MKLLANFDHFQVLTIDPVNEGDTGSYSCISENIAGYAERYWAVDVFTRPVIVFKPKAEISSLVGEEIILECEARGNPKPVMSWQKDGKPVAQNTHVQIDDSGIVFFNFYSFNTVGI